MKFTFSEQENQNPSEDRAGNLADSQESASVLEGAENEEEMFERLKEDAHVYGWEFDEVKQVFRPVPAF